MLAHKDIPAQQLTNVPPCTCTIIRSCNVEEETQTDLQDAKPVLWGYPVCSVKSRVQVLVTQTWGSTPSLELAQLLQNSLCCSSLFLLFNPPNFLCTARLDAPWKDLLLLFLLLYRRCQRTQCCCCCFCCCTGGVKGSVLLLLLLWAIGYSSSVVYTGFLV